MKEPEQSLERSKSADDVVGDKFRRRDDFSHHSRSHTADRLCVAPQKSPHSPTTLMVNHRAVEERYHLLTPGVPHYAPPPRRDGFVSDSGLGESVERISIGGFSDNDGIEDDLSDTETDNEWDGCEVTRVWPWPRALYTCFPSPSLQHLSMCMSPCQQQVCMAALLMGLCRLVKVD